jgi:hypothetical protein
VFDSSLRHQVSKENPAIVKIAGFFVFGRLQTVYRLSDLFTAPQTATWPDETGRIPDLVIGNATCPPRQHLDRPRPPAVAPLRERLAPFASSNPSRSSKYSMSRKPSGSAEDIRRALDTAETTQSAVELRRALAVVLPVLHGLSLKATALLVGRSETWVAKERQHFIQDTLPERAERSVGGIRNRLIPADQEDAFMESVCKRYIHVHGGAHLHMYTGKDRLRKLEMSFVEIAQLALEELIQRPTTRTTVYNLMSRTGKKRFFNYKPYMWELACKKGLPVSVYRDEKISETLANIYGFSRKKPRKPK